MLSLLMGLFMGLLGVCLIAAGVAAFVALPIIAFPFGFIAWLPATFAILLGLLYLQLAGNEL